MYRILIACLLTVACAAACTNNRVTEDDSLARYFAERGVRGTFALLNNNSGDFTVHNLERYRDSAYTPASTFKIVNALIGLQTGIISSDTMVIPWDGRQREAEAWNRDLGMAEAFRASAVPYFQEVARRIGKDTMQFWLDSLSYGSRQIRGPIDSFWLDGSLTITPDEQLGLVKRLYFNELPFHRINQEAVKRAMVVEDKPQYRLSYKTGWAGWDEQKGRSLAWVVGFIEENRHPYFFVLNLESPDRNLDMVRVRGEILRGILGELGFFQGTK